jgi:hypothetical protein
LPWARFAVGVRDETGERELWSAEMSPMSQPRDRQWPLEVIDLSPWAGRSITLILHLRGVPARPDLAGWGDPRLVVADAAGS